MKLDREAAQRAKVPEKKVETKPSFSTPIDVSAISINVGYEFCRAILISSGSAPPLLNSELAKLTVSGSKQPAPQQEQKPRVEVQIRPLQSPPHQPVQARTVGAQPRVVSPREGVNPAVRPSQAQLRESMANKMVYGVDPDKTGGEYKWSVTPKLVQVSHLDFRSNKLQISSAGPHLWGLDSHGMIWRWTGAAFQQVTGQLRQISVSVDGSVWGVNFA